MMVEEERAADAQRVDARVLDYVARAPMTYPVPFDLLPKWPPAPTARAIAARERSDRR